MVVNKTLARLACKIILCTIGFILVAGGSGVFPAGAGPEVGKSPQKSPMAHATIEEVLSRHAPQLLAIPGVVGVAQGECAGRPCLRVFVRQKTPELERKIPATLEGYPVEIKESGEFRALPEEKQTPRNR